MSSCKENNGGGKERDKARYENDVGFELGLVVAVEKKDRVEGKEKRMEGEILEAIKHGLILVDRGCVGCR